MTAVELAKLLIEETWESPERSERNCEAAAAILQAALQVDPTDPILLTCMGAVLSDQGEHAQAVGFLEKAIELGSSDRHTFYNLAVALMNCDAESRERARAYFRKAEELQPCAQTWEAYFDAHAH